MYMITLLSLSVCLARVKFGCAVVFGGLIVPMGSNFGRMTPVTEDTFVEAFAVLTVIACFMNRSKYVGRYVLAGRTASSHPTNGSGERFSGAPYRSFRGEMHRQDHS